MSDDVNERVVEATERISKVLGALYALQMGDLEPGLKAQRLSRCGFQNTEIADLLGTSPNAINIALHRVRTQRKKARRVGSKKVN